MVYILVEKYNHNTKNGIPGLSGWYLHPGIAQKVLDKKKAMNYQIFSGASFHIQEVKNFHPARTNVH
jgi:hypothetical protein